MIFKNLTFFTFIRAFHDTKGKLYVLLNAENINYETSVLVERMFLETTVTNREYKIVFIASKEFNEQSYITTALDQDRRPVPDSLPQQQLQEYVSGGLRKHQGGTVADPDGLRARMVVSRQAGNGKSNVVHNLSQRFQFQQKVVTQIHNQKLDYAFIIQHLFERFEPGKGKLFHFDIATTTEDKEDFIFSLAILGALVDPRSGRLWLASASDYYPIELTLPKQQVQPAGGDCKKYVALYDVLPSITCLCPREALASVVQDVNNSNLFPTGHVKSCSLWRMGLDVLKIRDKKIVRLCKDLAKAFKRQLTNNLGDYLNILLDHCCVEDPSWSEVTNFASFLSYQLTSCDKNVFCHMPEDLPGFKNFVVKFLIRMSQDFATRSLYISDESQGETFAKPKMHDRRRWENSPHPYLFFNEDGQTMSFFGFILNGQLDMVEEKTLQARCFLLWFHFILSIYLLLTQHSMISGA